MHLTIDINGKIIRKIGVWNCHPHPTSGVDMCPYQVTDDLTETSFFVTHKRSDGAGALAKIVLDKLNDYFFMKEIEDEKIKKEKEEKEKTKEEKPEVPEEVSGPAVVPEGKGISPWKM